ncbi:peroxisomal 2,4-dienoyl-CoA reductase [(3E)-enoyl-CoA-producing]-like isoform X2 [Panicum virgatum]|uniref:peroxisomal 2,4-dienoyl-CoA reductase [(3E)-enoyl-CoA-producing]-like isoform X2 n=1 Tax=Panicum virgatum TaxID=38727 RepID=UPI0019D68F90|nr:peroxisomal 2,4-dienoyl-CoA reductase [(3E)-enoyl-CoA-producing]-like isoform X2 [Panicum virgatum]
MAAAVGGTPTMTTTNSASSAPTVLQSHAVRCFLWHNPVTHSRYYNMGYRHRVAKPRAFLVCYEAMKYLKKGGPGRAPSSGGLIINISATLHYTAAWYQIHVSAAKASVDSITRSLALEWGADYDIRVNGIAPGPIQDTPGMRKLAPEEMSKGRRETTPLFKLGEKWDIAMAALYLASDAGKYVNGATIIVDGGLWLSRPRHIPKEEVKALSKVVEKKVRTSGFGVPSSKL